MRWLRFSIVPALACLSVAIAVLPRTGGDAKVRMIEAADGTVHFDPGDLRVPVGARVLFLNEGKRTHAAICADCSPADTWTTGLLQPGEDVFLTFSEEAAFAYGDPAGPPESRARLIVGEPSAPAESPTPSPAGSAPAAS